MLNDIAEIFIIKTEILAILNFYLDLYRIQEDFTHN